MSSDNGSVSLPRDFIVGGGWVVKERQSNKRVRISLNRDGVLGRWSVTYYRCPSLKEVRVFHHVGANEVEMREHLRIACTHIAKPRCTYMSGRWKRMKPKWAAGAGVYATQVGLVIDEATEFERLSIGLRSDDAIDVEFRELAKQLSDSESLVSPSIQEVNLREK